LIVSRSRTDSTSGVTVNSRHSPLIDIPGWNTQWIHLGPGPLNHQATRLAYGSGTVATLQTSSAGILRGCTAPGSMSLLASFPGAQGPRSEAQPIGGDNGLLLGPSSNVDLYLQEGGEVIVLSAPAAGVAAGSRRLKLDSHQASSLAHCMESLQQLRSAGDSEWRAGAAPRELRTMLRAVSESVFQHVDPQLHARPARLLRHLAVVRACDYIEANLRAPLSLADLCASAGVSTRALEYGFRDFYALGPMAYVRSLRLCRVREDLLDSTRNGNSVSNTARRWCFTHMGQFSHDYRELFGEMPSTTLVRPDHAGERPRGGMSRG
jgi:AraC-like DNA-binding protein